MSAADVLAASILATTAEASSLGVVARVASGVIANVGPTVGASQMVATITGISHDPVLVPDSSFTAAFAAEVAAGSVVNRRVLVLFVDRQAVIIGTIGGGQVG